MDRSSQWPPYSAVDAAISGDKSKPGCWLAALAMAVFVLCFGAAGSVWATPALMIDRDSGAILYAEEATQAWYPASLTKLMTVYVALKAVHDHHISLDTPLVVSARAASMPPSRMGFRPGSMVTLGTALKILMVKSANDVAITVAEGVSGSVEAFADDMNDAAASLGMTESHFANPNGLPNPEHFSSARDLAILARALYMTFPEQADLFDIGALAIEGKVIPNHNNLLGRYPGVDGMKTGFTCAAGFNVVASATQGGKRLIVVVLGSPNVALRTIKTSALFDRGFAGIDHPSGSLLDLRADNTSPPNMQNAICRNRGAAIAAANADIERLIAPVEAANAQAFAAPDRAAYNSSALSRIAPMATRIMLVPPPSFDPVPVSVGIPAGYVGPIAQARPGHTPIGTEAPPETMRAYAPLKQPTLADGAPLAPDASALPMKGRHKLALRARAKRAHAHRTRSRQKESETADSEPSAKDAKAAAKPAHAAKISHASKSKSIESKSAAAKVKTDAIETTADAAGTTKGKVAAHAHRRGVAKARKPHGETAAAAPKATAKKTETNVVQ